MHSTLLLVLVACGCAAAFQNFQNSIPNGVSVPHPCANGQTFPAVGHMSPAGGDQRNAFGLAFKASGNRWTRALCNADSDGDGISNGAELGDATCQWAEGQGFPTGTARSHPGFCEPVESPNCKSKPQHMQFRLGCRNGGGINGGINGGVGQNGFRNNIRSGGFGSTNNIHNLHNRGRTLHRNSAGKHNSNFVFIALLSSFACAAVFVN